MWNATRIIKNQLSRSKQNIVRDKGLEVPKIDLIPTPSFRIKDEFDSDIKVNNSLGKVTIDRNSDYDAQSISQRTSKKSNFSLTSSIDDKVSSRSSRSGRAVKIPSRYLEQTQHEVNNTAAR